MNNIAQTNEMKSFSHSSSDDEKFNKNKQLTSSMSIKPTEPDSYETKIKSLGGDLNG